jgi:hypothetical protein
MNKILPRPPFLIGSDDGRRYSVVVNYAPGGSLIGREVFIEPLAV